MLLIVISLHLHILIQNIEEKALKHSTDLGTGWIPAEP
jgi:hypothetical protein